MEARPLPSSDPEEELGTIDALTELMASPGWRILLLEAGKYLERWNEKLIGSNEIGDELRGRIKATREFAALPKALIDEERKRRANARKSR